MSSQPEELEFFAYPGTENVRLSPANTRPTVETNRASVLNTSRAFSFEDRPLPRLQTSQHVRIRIVATGLCGSDISATTLTSRAGRNCLCVLVVANTKNRSTIGSTNALADTLSTSRSSSGTSSQASSKSAEKTSRASRSVIVWRWSLV